MRYAPLSLFLAAFLTVAAAPRLASAQPPPTEDAPGFSWRWRRHAWYDYVFTGSLAAGAAVELALPPGTESGEVRRSGGLLFDDAIRDALVLGSTDARHGFGNLSNVTLAIAVAYPVLDGAIGAWAVRQSPDVAWQMTMINLQSFAFASLMTGAIKRAADRERPIATECAGNPTYDVDCANADNHHSFPSGHSSMAFTGASLTCLHHFALDLYDGPGDALACVGAMATATVTAWSRIVSDKHYMTDVFSGAVLGGISGGVLPWLLYYAWDTPPTGDTQATLVPTISEDHLGISITGVLR